MSAGATIADQGYVVLPGVLGPDVVDRARAALADVLAAEALEAEDEGWHTDTYRVSYGLPVKDPWFVELCQHAELLRVAREALGPDAVVAACNGFAVVPGGPPQELHIDQAEAVGGPSMYVHLVCTLDEFTAQSGATRAVPGSHRWSEPPGPLEDLEHLTVPLTAPAGSLIAFDGRLVHGAGQNHTDRPRRALHVFFARPWVQPHWDFPRSFTEATAATLSPVARTLFGFGAAPPQVPGVRPSTIARR